MGWEPAIPARILLRIATGRPARRARDIQCPLLVSVCDQDLLAPGVPAGLRSVSYGVFEGSRIAAGATGCRRLGLCRPAGFDELREFADRDAPAQFIVGRGNPRRQVLVQPGEIGAFV